MKIAKTQLILDATHSGRSNFIVKPIAPDGSTGSSIVNEIGIYGGRHLILDPTKVVALQISADGAWKFTFDGLNALRMATPAERYESSGDDVLLVSKLPSSGLIRATFTATTSNFIVRPFDRNGKGSSSLVNEIAPWSGTVVVKNDTTLLEVTAEGPWTMALTS